MVQQDIAPADQVKQTAKRMGINTDIRAVDAIALGTSEVFPIEMVSAIRPYQIWVFTQSLLQLQKLKTGMAT